MPEMDLNTVKHSISQGSEYARDRQGSKYVQIFF